MKFYNSNIQLSKEVIEDVFSNIKQDTKMLVFGLGFDSKMWFEATNKNTYFVENKDEYIRLNEKSIPSEYIIKYDFETKCNTCMKLSDREISNFKLPQKLLNLAPFDIILIDGPEGYYPTAPGRLIPCFWSQFLSKPGTTIIYVDDSQRPIEDFCIKKFFPNKKKYELTKRFKTTKIYF